MTNVQFLRSRSFILPALLLSFIVNYTAIQAQTVSIQTQASYTNPLPVTFQSFTVNAETGYNELRWKIVKEPNLREFAVEYSLNSIDWAQAGAIIPQKNDTNTSSDYYYKHPTNEEGNMYYRLKLIDKDNTYTYSKIISLNTRPDKGSEMMLYPAVTTYGQLQVQLKEPFGNLQVFNMQGQKLLVRNLQDQTGVIRLDISGLSKGVYTVVASRPDKTLSKTFMVQ